MIDLHHHRRIMSTATPTQNAVRKISEAENSLIFAASQNQRSSRVQVSTQSVGSKSRPNRDLLLQKSTEDKHDRYSARENESNAQFFASVSLGITVRHIRLSQSNWSDQFSQLKACVNCFTVAENGRWAVR